jgi:hypothetical protein
MNRISVLIALLIAAASSVPAVEPDSRSVPGGWSTGAPRAELRPQFSYLAAGGPTGGERFVIESDKRAGLVGWWTRTIPVEGGKYYRFQALRKLAPAEASRRTAVARVIWQDEKGQLVMQDEPSTASYQPGAIPRAEPEYPRDRNITAEGWTEVTDDYRAPSRARQAVLELHFRWASHARLEWSDVALAPIPTPTPRRVRLATVHYQPKDGKTPDDKRRLFAPLIADAARQKADFVVLPETLTYFGTGLSMVECAEPIPGPSSTVCLEA